MIIPFRFNHTRPFWVASGVVTAVLVLWSVLALTYPQLPIVGRTIHVFQDDSDFQVYFSNLGWIHQGELLFNNGYTEYPPLGLIYVNWPSWFTNSFGVYSAWLWFSNALFYLGVSVVTYRLASKLGRSIAHTWWWWLLPSTVYYSLNRFDVLPVFLLALSLLLFLEGRLRSGWLIYGLSIMTKLYPIFVLPLVLSLTHKSGRSVWHYLPYALAPIVGLSLGVAQVGGWLAVVYPYLLQLARQVEPGGALALIVAVWPGALDYLALFKLGQLTVPLWWLVRVVRGSRLSLQAGFILTAISLLLSILFSSFYSNQWWVWVLPFLVLTLPPSAGVLVVAHDVLNYLQTPIMLELFGRGSPPFNVVVGLRSLVMLALVVVLWQQLPKRWWVLT